jgi:NAD(P)-dependent dehydrogenase (short-subunit alcohol dehydrogenase family)
VRGLVKSTALEVGRHGITANVVAPGGIDGERLRRLFRQSAERQGRQESEVLDDFLKSAALGRLVDGADIMAAVLHLLGPGGRNITGQDLVVDAGTII